MLCKDCSLKQAVEGSKICQGCSVKKSSALGLGGSEPKGKGAGFSTYKPKAYNNGIKLKPIQKEGLKQVSSPSEKSTKKKVDATHLNTKPPNHFGISANKHKPTPINKKPDSDKKQAPKKKKFIIKKLTPGSNKFAIKKQTPGKDKPSTEKPTLENTFIHANIGALQGDPSFVHRWGCVQLIVSSEGILAPESGVEEVCEEVAKASFPVLLPDGACGGISQVGVKLAEKGMRLLAIPQTLFELFVIVTAEYTVNRVKKDIKNVAFSFAGEQSEPGPTEMICKKLNINLHTFQKFDDSRLKEYAGLNNKKFLVYANQLVVSSLCSILELPGLPEVLTREQCLTAADALFKKIRDDSSKAGKLSEHQETLRDVADEKNLGPIFRDTISREYEECDGGRPGFQLYRVSTKYSELESLTKDFDSSWGISLFGGWFFDGPTNSSSSACVTTYLRQQSPGNWNYYVLRIRMDDYLSRSSRVGVLRKLKSLMLPPVPIGLQMFGFEGGFHARMAKPTAAEISPFSENEAKSFMKKFYLSWERVLPDVELIKPKEA
jgi:hypothetical protein